MTKAAELFLEELKKHNLTHMPVAEDGDKTIIPVGFNLKNTNVEIYTLFSPNNSVSVTCAGFLTINEEQFPQVLLCCNHLNQEMRWAKFYIDDDLDVTVEDDAIVNDVTGGEEVLGLVMRMAAIIEEAYPKLNRAIWA